MRSLYPIHEDAEGLNESPSKKEGKFLHHINQVTNLSDSPQ